MISECREYSQYNFLNYTVQSAVLGESASERQKDDCGHKSVELIVGGTEATDREFPHMVSIHKFYFILQNYLLWRKNYFVGFNWLPTRKLRWLSLRWIADIRLLDNLSCALREHRRRACKVCQTWSHHKKPCDKQLMDSHYCSTCHLPRLQPWPRTRRYRTLQARKRSEARKIRCSYLPSANWSANNEEGHCHWLGSQGFLRRCQRELNESDFGIFQPHDLWTSIRRRRQIEQPGNQLVEDALCRIED